MDVVVVVVMSVELVCILGGKPSVITVSNEREITCISIEEFISVFVRELICFLSLDGEILIRKSWKIGSDCFN